MNGNIGNGSGMSELRGSDIELHQSYCDGYSTIFLTTHAFSCKEGCLIYSRYDEIRDT